MRKIAQEIHKEIQKDIKNYRIAILLFIVYSAAVRCFFHAFCPQLILTGIPCAGCGMTRAMLCILTGQPVRAMNLNPAAVFWLAWLSCYFADRYISGGRRRKKILYLLVAVCILTLAVYAYRMYTQFPSYPPMTYYRNNILSKLLPFYHEMLRDIHIL